MKRTLTIALTAALLLAGSLQAQPERHTIVVRDGKVLQDGRAFALDDVLQGFPRTYLGVSLVDLTPALRDYFGAPKEAGVLVSDVAPGGPAEKAGIKAGDVIVSLEGKNVASSGEVRRALREKKKGESARVEVLRGKSRHTLVATVAQRELPGIPPMPDVRLEELSERLNEKFNSPEWRARLESMGNCGELQERIRELEVRLKDLEKKLQK